MYSAQFCVVLTSLVLLEEFEEVVEVKNVCRKAGSVLWLKEMTSKHSVEEDRPESQHLNHQLS